MYTLCVLGTFDVGKTYFICRFVDHLNNTDKTKKNAGFIPFEKNLTEKNKAEKELDSTLLYRHTDQSLHANHCGLYAFYHNYPFQFSAACEGIKIKKKLFRERMGFLETQYETLLLEYGESVLMPLFENNDTFASFMKENSYRFIYIIDSAQDKFETVLGDLHALAEKGINGSVLLNNRYQSTDVKWFEFIWRAVIEFGYDVVGILPYSDGNKEKKSEAVSVFEAIKSSDLFCFD